MKHFYDIACLYAWFCLPVTVLVCCVFRFGGAASEVAE